VAYEQVDLLFGRNSKFLQGIVFSQKEFKIPVREMVFFKANLKTGKENRFP
jgi:hypothetical protein